MKIESKNWKCVCDSCSYQWTTRNEVLPKICPKCKTRAWDDKSQWAKNQGYVRVENKPLELSSLEEIFTEKEVVYDDDFGA